MTSADAVSRRRRRLAVLGSPIHHSKSPALHSAAYDALGLDWEYSAIEVAEGSLEAFLKTLDETWRGLSLTMPLKREILPMLASRSAMTLKADVANTVLIGSGDDGALRFDGYNTDVSGVTGALEEHGLSTVRDAHVLGAGATAASTIIGLAHLGAQRILVTARRPEALAELSSLAARADIVIETRLPGESLPFRAQVLVDTLPGGAELGGAEALDLDEVDDVDALLAVAYSPWPTPRASRVASRGGVVIDGLLMLLHQAIGQVRIFTTGSPYGELENEKAVIRAMRQAVERS